MNHLTLGTLTLTPDDITALSIALVDRIARSCTLSARLEEAMETDINPVEELTARIEDLESEVNDLTDDLRRLDKPDAIERMRQVRREVRRALEGATAALVTE